MKALLTVTFSLWMMLVPSLSGVLNDGQEKKLTKVAGAEARRLKKDGWKTAAGTLPLEYQIERTYRMMYLDVNDTLPEFLFGDASSSGGCYDAARMQAVELAKIDLAGKIQTDVTSLVENSVRNERISAAGAESFIRTVRESKNLITARLGVLETVIDCYRNRSGDVVEVRVVLSCSRRMALEYVREVLKEAYPGAGRDEYSDDSDFLFL